MLDAAEVDRTLIQRLKFFIDYHSSDIDQTNGFLNAIEECLIAESHNFDELGHLFSESYTGRIDINENTCLWPRIQVW